MVELPALAMTTELSNTRDETRFSGLIWRSIKLKWFLLIFMLLLLWVIWSALASARQKITNLEKDFIHDNAEIAQGLKSAGIKEENISEDGNSTKAAILIEEQRRIQSFFSSGLPKDQSGPFDEKLRKIDRFQSQLRGCYSASISLPYLVNPLEVSTIMVADAWPFVVLFLFSVIASVGFRQKAYEVLLAELVNKSEADRPQALGAAQFLVGTFQEVTHDRPKILLYFRRLLILPEPLISALLTTAVCVFSLRTIADYNPTLIHPTKSIFFSYYFLFWSALVLAGLYLVSVHRFFAKYIHDVLGATVRDGHIYTALRPASRLTRIVERLLVRRPSLSHALTLGMVLAAGASLAFPWISPWGIKGYELLLPQKPLPPSAIITIPGLPPPEVYKISPPSFRELTAHAWLGVTLLALTASSLLLSQFGAPRSLRETLRLVHKWTGYLVLFAAGNFLLYLGILEFESEVDPTLAIMDSFFPEGIVGPHGAPLDFAEPTWYSFAFLLVCVLLALSAAMRTPQRRG